MATAGLYSLSGQELFLSWGYREEAHCSWTSYRRSDGWTPPHEGCPRIRVTNGTLFLPAAGRLEYFAIKPSRAESTASPERSSARALLAGEDDPVLVGEHHDQRPPAPAARQTSAA